MQQCHFYSQSGIKVTDSEWRSLMSLSLWPNEPITLKTEDTLWWVFGYLTMGISQRITYDGYFSKDTLWWYFSKDTLWWVFLKGYLMMVSFEKYPLKWVFLKDTTLCWVFLKGHLMMGISQRIHFNGYFSKDTFWWVFPGVFLKTLHNYMHLQGDKECNLQLWQYCDNYPYQYCNKLQSSKCLCCWPYCKNRCMLIGLGLIQKWSNDLPNYSNRFYL